MQLAIRGNWLYVRVRLGRWEFTTSLIVGWQGWVLDTSLAHTRFILPWIENVADLSLACPVCRGFVRFVRVKETL